MTPIEVVTYIFSETLHNSEADKVWRSMTGPVETLLDEGADGHTGAVAWLAYKYSHNVLKRRWPEAENVVLMDPIATYSYAALVVGDRWPEGEVAFLASEDKSVAQAIHDYVTRVIRTPWPAGEAKLKEMSEASFWADRYTAWKARQTTRSVRWRSD